MKLLIPFLFCFGALAVNPPTLPAIKTVTKTSVVKGGQALMATPKASATNAQPSSVTLAWNNPPGGYDCLTVWASTNLIDWYPKLTVPSNVTTCVIFQPTNTVMFFVIKAENESLPSNCVTNSTINLK